MIRARTFTDARQQAHSNAELNWWIFMRLSGLILMFLVLLVRPTGILGESLGKARA